MKEQVIKLVKENHDEYYFKYHILPVVKNALLLGKKLNADLDVVEIASYLHDIGKEGTDDYEQSEHHVVGAEKTKKILKEMGYDNEFIKKVEHCVLTHRGRKGPPPETLEAKIVACADAMAHYDTFLALVKIFLKTNDSFEQAIIEIDKKMDRGWNKKLTIPEAKEIVKEKYEAIKLLLESMKEYID